MFAGESLDGRFVTTRWATVTVAGDTSSPSMRAALERLCEDYWGPLVAYALRKGRDLHNAQDLTQAFFAHFIERGYLRAADRMRGKFRTFLLTCFQHFMIHEWEKERSARRGGQFTIVSWEEHDAAILSRIAAATDLTAERIYDREWAFAVTRRALLRLEEEFSASGRSEHFQVLGRFLYTEPVPGEYDTVASKLNLASGSVKLLVHRLRRRYGMFVREEVRQTLVNESDLEDELRYLVELLSV
jgi:DNA-directed RNA polymerase specialized sigma24 family protein